MLFYVTLKRHKIKLTTTCKTQQANPAAFKTFLNTKDIFISKWIKILQILCDKQRKFSLSADSTRSTS